MLFVRPTATLSHRNSKLDALQWYVSKLARILNCNRVATVYDTCAISRSGYCGMLCVFVDTRFQI